MNITDTAAPVRPPTWRAMLTQIFARQAELMAKYQTIEGLPPAPLILHHPEAQRILKDFAWRTVEELTESYEAWLKHGTSRDIAEMHALEELADAWHFFTELLIFAGITAEDCLLPPSPNFLPEGITARTQVSSSDSYWCVTYQLGLAMNFLRNKPWKQSHVPVDVVRFKQALMVTYREFCLLWHDLGYHEGVLYDYYFKKSEVNKFRQRSQY